MQVLSEGQYIKHELYGLGIVTASDAERTTIEFEDHGTKKFVTSLMTAEVVGNATPKPKLERARRRRKKATASSRA